MDWLVKGYARLWDSPHAEDTVRWELHTNALRWREKVEKESGEGTAKAASGLEKRLKSIASDSKDEEELKRAAVLCGYIGSEAILPILRRFGTEKWPAETRKAILEACQFFGDRYVELWYNIVGGQVRVVVNGGFYREEAEKLLLDVVQAKDESIELRGAALHSLRAYHGKAVLEAVLDVAKDLAFRRETVEVLGGYWSEEKRVRDLFTDLVAKNGPSTAMAAAVGGALSKIDDEATIPLLIELSVSQIGVSRRLEHITGLESRGHDPAEFWKETRAKQPELFKIKEHRSYYPEKRGLFELKL